MTRAWPLAALLAIAVVACGDDGGAAEPRDVDCDAAALVATAHDTLAAIVESALGPISASIDPTETQRLIDTRVPTMVADLHTLTPALTNALGDLGQSLPAGLTGATADVTRFVQRYTAQAADIDGIAGVDSLIAYEQSADGVAYTDAVRQLDSALQAACGITLRVER